MLSRPVICRYGGQCRHSGGPLVEHVNVWATRLVWHDVVGVERVGVAEVVVGFGEFVVADSSARINAETPTQNVVPCNIDDRRPRLYPANGLGNFRVFGIVQCHSPNAAP